MQKLHLVGFTADFDGLIFSTRKGAKSGSFVVPVDARLLKQIAEVQGRRDGGPSRADEHRLASPRLVRPESSLNPREMQDRIRAGWSVDEVAAEAGVDLDWVRRFAAPVLAEVRRVIERSRDVVYDKPRFGLSSLPLGASVRRNVLDRGVQLLDEELDDCWSAHQLDEDAWIVRFAYTSRGRLQEAEWLYDIETEELSSRNRLASQLGHVVRGRKRSASAATSSMPKPSAATKQAARRPAPAPVAKRPAPKKVTPKKVTAKKVVAKKVTAKKVAAKRPPAKKAPAKKVAARPAPRRAVAKSAAPRRSSATRAPAKRTTATKAPAKKAPGRPTPTPTPTPTPARPVARPSAPAPPAPVRNGSTAPPAAPARPAPARYESAVRRPTPAPPVAPALVEAPPVVERRPEPAPPVRQQDWPTDPGLPRWEPPEAPPGPLPAPGPAPVPESVRQAVATPIGDDVDPPRPGATDVDPDTGVARIDSRRNSRYVSAPPPRPVFRSDVGRAGPPEPPAPRRPRRTEPLRGR